MKVWLACVILLFGAAELYHWLQGVTLSLPICGVTGLLLAVASNSRFWLRAKPLEAPSLTTAIDLDISQLSESPSFPSAAARPSAQLPNLTPPTSPSISFEIAKKK